MKKTRKPKMTAVEREVARREGIVQRCQRRLKQMKAEALTEEESLLKKISEQQQILRALRSD